ncbi:hypothetical protein GCM10009548_24580 [Streptomyces malaysiensis subsp. malaysiensis]
MRHIPNHLRELVRAEDEHRKDNERDKLERSYVQHLAAPQDVWGPGLGHSTPYLAAGSAGETPGQQRGSAA